MVVNFVLEAVVVVVMVWQDQSAKRPNPAQKQCLLRRVSERQRGIDADPVDQNGPDRLRAIHPW